MAGGPLLVSARTCGARASVCRGGPSFRAMCPPPPQDVCRCICTGSWPRGKTRVVAHCARRRKRGIRGRGRPDRAAQPGGFSPSANAQGSQVQRGVEIPPELVGPSLRWVRRGAGQDMGRAACFMPEFEFGGPCLTVFLPCCRNGSNLCATPGVGGWGGWGGGGILLVHNCA